MAKLLLAATLLCLGLVSVRGLTNEELAALLTGAVGLGNLDIVSDPQNSDYFIVSSHGMPNHTLGPWGRNPNDATHQDHNYRIPKNPTVQAEPSCTPMGPIGLALSGAAIYNPYTGECYDAGMLEADGFDDCKGHPSPDGTYHYHITPTCIFNVSEVPSPIIGVALDGFPIYGPTDETGRALTSADLDECHGRQVNGQYRYHVTSDFPYFLGCFKGAPVDARVTARRCQCRERADPCRALSGGDTGDGMTRPPGGMGPYPGGMRTPPAGMMRPAPGGTPPVGMMRPAGGIALDRDALLRLGIVCPTGNPVANDRELNNSGSKARLSGMALLIATVISFAVAA
ncbi:uncharacterized protein [Branchiostoma lanceolatum]|uniref:uncharacterized protein n=1 Tax=Branchiostoma lanceolatum TaxID=7740 RepID=UPI003453E45A